jgi:hypothetical protein
MTAGEIYAQVARRLLDVGASDYTPESLRDVYWHSLNTLARKLAANHVPAAEATYYGRLQKDATVMQPAFHQIPNEAPYSMELSPLAGTYTLREQVPVVVPDEGVTVYFDQDASLPRGELYIVREKRMPAINGPWGVRLAEDKRSALLVGALGTVVGDQTEANAGMALVSAGGWYPIEPTYQGDRFRFNAPMPEDRLFRLKVRGFTAASYLDDWATCPVAAADAFLINHTAALAVGDREGDRSRWMADAEMDFALLLAAQIAQMQTQVAPIDYRKRPHMPAVRRGNWR